MLWSCCVVCFFKSCVTEVEEDTNPILIWRRFKGRFVYLKSQNLAKLQSKYNQKWKIFPSLVKARKAWRPIFSPGFSRRAEAIFGAITHFCVEDSADLFVVRVPFAETPLPPVSLPCFLLSFLPYALWIMIFTDQFIRKSWQSGNTHEDSMRFDIRVRNRCTHFGILIYQIDKL